MWDNPISRRLQRICLLSYLIPQRREVKNESAAEKHPGGKNLICDSWKHTLAFPVPCTYWFHNLTVLPWTASVIKLPIVLHVVLLTIFWSCPLWKGPPQGVWWDIIVTRGKSRAKLLRYSGSCWLERNSSCRGKRDQCHIWNPGLNNKVQWIYFLCTWPKRQGFCVSALFLCRLNKYTLAMWSIDLATCMHSGTLQ